MSAPSSKKIKEVSTDHLSALPDGILCYILSFLETKEAAITCQLSKRWQFLWTQSPALRFKDGYLGETKRKLDFVIRVHRTLAICSRQNLERFELDFTCSYDQSFASDVNVWIGFAVENKVKNVSLLLNNSIVPVHTLPQMMYSNPCWTSLRLRGCTIYPRGTIQWQSLTTLRMEHLELNENTFEKIFSGCPFLSSLDLVLCSGFNCLEVNSSSLRTLAIDCGHGGDLKISAPYIHTFKIVWRNSRRMLRLENVKSLVEAEVLTLVQGIARLFPFENSKDNLKQLLGSTQHVKMLKLSGDCIELLSSVATSWQPPQSTIKSLEINVQFDYKGILGIVTILKSSPFLETLVIHGDDCRGFDVPGSKDDLDCDLFHLKTVCFKNFGKFSPDKRKLLPKLVRILLKRAIVLEKMVVSFRGPSAKSVGVLYKMAQTLLSYPRSSQKAVVLFN